MIILDDSLRVTDHKIFHASHSKFEDGRYEFVLRQFWCDDEIPESPNQYTSDPSTTTSVVMTLSLQELRYLIEKSIDFMTKFYKGEL